MNTKHSKVISLLLAFVMLLSVFSTTTVFAVSEYYSKLEATNASVTLDGTNPGSVTVSIIGNADMNVYAIQGDWDTKETEGTGKLTLNAITTDVSNVKFTGMNYADAPTGKVLWTDDTFDAPAVLTDGTKFLNATYTVAADTPSGTYTVRFKYITLTATDYNSYTDEVYHTAKITVTNNGGGGSTGSYYDKLEATNASVALDGTNPGSVTVSIIGNADMNVYAIQGDWDTKETEGTGKLTLNAITTDVSNVKFTGMNYADAPTGKVLWTDDTFDAPAVLTDGTKFLNATYTVAADTPAGTYTVRFKYITLTATDYNSYTDEVYHTAKITVTRPAAHVCSNGTKQAGQGATCTVDGWNDYYKCSCGKFYEEAACTTLIPDLAAWKAGDGRIPAAHDYGTLKAAQPEIHTATVLKASVAAHYFCDVCDTYFTEGKVATTLPELTGTVPSHNYANQYGYKGDDGHADTCSCGAKNTVVGHTADRPAPTETEDKKCSLCGFVIEPKTGHIHRNNLTPVVESGATCTTDGYKAHYKCSCGAYFEDATANIEIPDIAAWKNGAGKIAKKGHDYTEQIKDAAHLKAEAANCTECDTYWYDCSRCSANAKNDPAATNKFYTSTDAGDHNFNEKLADAAHLVAGTGTNCQSAKKYYYDCAYCATKGTNTWTSTSYGDHKFDEKIADAAHLVAGTGANCQDAKEYYYDCAYCAEIGTTSWASTTMGDHKFNTAEWGYKDKAAGHAHKCNFCTEHDTVQPHTPGAPATEDDDQICTTCLMVLETATGHICKSHLTKVPANGASCTVDGNIEYYECSCGKYYTDSTAAVEITDKNSVKINAGHNYGTLVQEEPAVHTATELKPGMKAHYFCDKCDTYFTAEKVATSKDDLTIPAPTHEYTTQYGYKGADGHADTCSCGAHNTVVPHTPDRDAATETDPIKCTACGYEITPALGHTCKNNLTKVAAEPATCTKDGNIEYYTCSCGKWYTDATASVEITDKDSVVIKAGHNYGTEWKSDKDNHWNECTCGDKANTAAHKDANADGKCDVCEYNVGVPSQPGDNPQTGDNSNMILWISLLMLSALGVVATTIIGKKRYSAK